MAFSDPITLADSESSNQSFTRQTSVQNGSNWVESDSTIDDTRTLIIRHSNAGKSVVKGAPPLQRANVAFQHAKFNSTLGVTEKAVINVNITFDSASSFLAGDFNDLAAFARNFFTETNLAKLMRKES